MSKWIQVPLGLGLRSNYAQEVFGAEGGGCSEALNVDIQSTVGSVRARKSDLQLYSLPPGAAVIRDIAQNIDGTNSTQPIAVLGSLETVSNITTFAVRGARKLPVPPAQIGELLSPDWYVPPGIGPDADRAMLEHRGSEIRVHCPNPIWFGLPRCISKITHDWPFAISLTEGTEGHTLIDGPFAASARIAKPTSEEVTVEALDNVGVGHYGQNEDDDFTDPLPMWGAQGHDPPLGKYEFAYWAISYVYDGYQESQLFLCPTRSHYSAGIAVDNFGAFRSTYADLIIKAVSTTASSLSKRIRKIRVYCAGATKETGDPLHELTFRLAHETDVADWNLKSTINRYAFSAVFDRNLVTHKIEGFTWDTNTEFCDVGEETLTHFATMENSLARIKIGEDEEHAYRCNAIYGRHIGPSDEQRNLHINVDLSPDQDAIDAAVGKWAINDRVSVSLVFPFSPSGDLPPCAKQRFFVGDELDGRQSYTELSGLQQVMDESISPDRYGGTSSGARPVIWGVTDKDGKVHPERWMWAKALPSAAIGPDIFPPENVGDFDFPIEAVVPIGRGYAFFGKNEVVTSYMEGEEAGWKISDVHSGIGCVSRTTIAETPYGVIYLSADGVRVLDRALFENPDGTAVVGATEAGVLSLPIAKDLALYLDEWANATAFYAPRQNHYVLHFLTSSKTFVYDFVRKGWMTIDTRGPLAILQLSCGCSGTDGSGLLCAYDTTGGNDGGVIVYSGDSVYLTDARYKLKVALGDPLRHKHIRRVVAHFTPRADAETHPFTVLISGENATGYRTTATLLPATGRKTKRLNLHDRLFTFECSNFTEISAVFVEVDAEDDRIR